MKLKAHLIIHGRVQGVCYRDFAREKARDLNVQGWVRNNPDGTVEALCEGQAENIQILIDWFCKGPQSADVKNVDIKKQPLEGEGLYGSFEIKY